MPPPDIDFVGETEDPLHSYVKRHSDPTFLSSELDLPRAKRKRQHRKTIVSLALFLNCNIITVLLRKYAHPFCMHRTSRNERGVGVYTQRYLALFEK